MSYKDRYIAKNGEVEEGSSILGNVFGGLKILGIPFIHSTKMKKFRWTSWVQTKEGDKIVEKPKSRKKKLIIFLLRMINTLSLWKMRKQWK